MENQTFVLRNEAVRRNAIGWIGTLPRTGGPWEVCVRRWHKDRSLAQNRLYWKWVNEIAAQTGEDPDALHDWLRRKFLGARPVRVQGEIVDFLPSTTFDRLDFVAEQIAEMCRRAASPDERLHQRPDRRVFHRDREGGREQIRSGRVPHGDIRVPSRVSRCGVGHLRHGRPRPWGRAMKHANDKRKRVKP